MSDWYRVWSFYQDASCSGAPTGVFMKKMNDCAQQLDSTSASCAAQYDSNNEVVGHLSESCHNGRAAGHAELYNGEPYMAYDYYYQDGCTDYGNSASYRAGGDCEPLYALDDMGKPEFRSATVVVSDVLLVWTRNRGTVDGALNCPGVGGEGYNVFEVPIEEVNSMTCKNFTNIGGGFIFYNTTMMSTSSSEGNTPGSDREFSDSAPSPSGSTSSDTALGDGTIVGIACGIAVVLVAIIALVCCRWKRSKNAENTSTHSTPFLPRSSAWTGGPTDDSEPSPAGPGLWNDNAIIATRVPRDSVTVQNLICRGGFGEVYRGTYGREAVAIKMLFPEMRSDLKKVNSFLAEAKLMAGLAHPHIVRFVGVSWGPLTDLCVLTELMNGGDLRTLLKEYEARGHPQGFDHDKIRIAYHVAQALTYLHSLAPIVIHRDLKSKNVLLTEDLDAKITDFGVSRERQENTMTAGVGTMLWMAPEVMMAEHYDEKADVFSFGVLLSELDLQSLPYAHARCDSVTGKKVPDSVILQKVALGALQVVFSLRCLASVVTLAKECIALDPSARPSAPMVVFQLQTIMKESFGEGYTV